MKKKISYPYLEKRKNVFYIYSLCSQNRSQFSIKTLETSRIIEATISLRYKCLYLRKSIRIQRFCFIYIEFFIISIQYHFIHVQKKNDCQVKTVVLILSFDVQ